MNTHEFTEGQSIEPAGRIIDYDCYGNPVYQVEVNGIEIGYKLMGRGEPLVLILGLGGTVDTWPFELIATLMEHYRLIMPDNRGMGYTTANEEPFTFEMFARDIIGLLDALNVKKSHVLGFSMGSFITQTLLIEYPHRLNKAIIHATLTDSRTSPLVQDGRLPNNPAVRRQFEIGSQWRTPMDRLPYITNQVMLLVGTADNIVGVESSKEIASAIPGAWLVQFKNGTHLLMNEAPRAVAGIVLTFLDRNEVMGENIIENI